jgi:hypothetical protein
MLRQQLPSMVASSEQLARGKKRRQIPPWPNLRSERHARA